MPKQFHFRKSATEAIMIAQRLLDKRSVRSTRDIPASAGVYIIRHKTDGILYVGQAVNLHRRVHGDHRSGERAFSTSSFRRALTKRYQVTKGRATTNWFDDNCRVAYAVIEDKEMVRLVEQLLITVLKKGGIDLLNIK